MNKSDDTILNATTLIASIQKEQIDSFHTLSRIDTISRLLMRDSEFYPDDSKGSVESDESIDMIANLSRLLSYQKGINSRLTAINFHLEKFVGYDTVHTKTN